MDYPLNTSLKRAIALLNSPADSGYYVVFKIEPDPFRCCHLHHWPETWDLINKTISPYGPIKEEGDALIGKNSGSFVLECHESGPEIIAYLALAAASLHLIKPIVELVTVIIKGKSKESKGSLISIKVSGKQFIKGKVVRENKIEITIPVGQNIDKQIEDMIKELLD